MLNPSASRSGCGSEFQFKLLTQDSNKDGAVERANWLLVKRTEAERTRTSLGDSIRWGDGDCCWYGYCWRADRIGLDWIGFACGGAPLRRFSGIGDVDRIWEGVDYRRP